MSELRKAAAIKLIRNLPRPVWMLILVASLGYFVDIYDLLLFSIIRVKSLESLHVPSDQLTSVGIFLINWQMAGLLLGGILWGLLGDKKGRLSVLFGSILLYSLANIANAFADSVPFYAALRFVAGIGLAGELGAGVTLITESLPIELRGFGTALIASIGFIGAIFAGLIADTFSWRVSYMIGGGLGLLILLLRVGVTESGLFNKTRHTNAKLGDIGLLFRQPKMLIKYVSVILIGIPIWYVIGILMTFTPEFAKGFGMAEIPTTGKAVMCSYTGLAIGDMASGFISHWLQSRKLVLFGYLLFMAFGIAVFMIFAKHSLTTYYWICGLLGLGAGYWAMFVTVAAEQFGTNIRSTVTTTTPNVVRGMVIPLTLGFDFLSHQVGVVRSGCIVGGIVTFIAVCALKGVEESYHKNLDYHELG